MERLAAAPLWTAGILGSLGLHAALFATAALLIELSPGHGPHTQITVESMDFAPVPEAENAALRQATVAPDSEDLRPRAPGKDAAMLAATDNAPSLAPARQATTLADTRRAAKAPRAPMSASPAARADSAAIAAIIKEDAATLGADQDAAPAGITHDAVPAQTVDEPAATAPARVAAERVAPAEDRAAVAETSPDDVAIAPREPNAATAILPDKAATVAAPLLPEEHAASRPHNEETASRVALAEAPLAAPASEAGRLAPSEAAPEKAARLPSVAGQGAEAFAPGEAPGRAARVVHRAEEPVATAAARPVVPTVNAARAPSAMVAPPAVPEARSAAEAMLAPVRPIASATEKERQAERYRTVGNFLKGFDGGPCFIAVPTMDASGTLKIESLGRNGTAQDKLGRSLTQATGIVADMVLREVDTSQCFALSFARNLPHYPDFPLSIRLDDPRVGSGTVLSGEIAGMPDARVHLLFIDDDGMVQRADQFMHAQPDGTRRFSAPVVLTGGPAGSAQLLMAIASSLPLEQLETAQKLPALEFFVRLGNQAHDAGASVDVALAAFSVHQDAEPARAPLAGTAP